MFVLHCITFANFQLEHEYIQDHEERGVCSTIESVVAIA